LDDTKRAIWIFGIRYLHAQVFVHRDVKPADIIIDADMHPLVADFGFVRGLSMGATSGARSSPGRDRTGGGTPYYMSSENRAQQYGLEADVWAFALVLHEIMTLRALVGDPVKERPALGDIGGPMERLIERCWADDPAEGPKMQEVMAEPGDGLVAMSGDRDEFRASRDGIKAF